MQLKDAGLSRDPWLAYTAQFLTIFFALALLTGRVYAQSYWRVFGASPELVETGFVDYTIISPNTAVASVMLAAGTIVLTALLIQRLPDLVGDRSLEALVFLGALIWGAGLFAISIIPKVDLSNWTSGTAGLAFGLGFWGFIGGPLIMMQAGKKLEQKPKSKWVLKLEQWWRINVAPKLPKLWLFNI